MKLKFENCRVHLIVTPTDLRSGAARLAGIALEKLNIDIFKGEDIVVFVSKSRGISKTIFADEKGSTMVTRTLHIGKFEQMLVKRNECGKVKLTITELEMFLNGEKIFEKRKNFYPSK